MFVELLDTLRCPQPHEDIWLVASFARIDERDMMEGVLGCPVCGAEYPVRNGVVELIAGEPTPAAALMTLPADPDLPVRVAALLDLADERGVALLTGAWTALADGIRAVSPTRLMLVAPPGSAAASPHAFDAVEGISRVVAYGVPIAPASVRAAAIDDSSGAVAVQRTVAAVKPGGRLIGRAALDVPPGCRELARDADLWVAEREAAPAGVITLASRRRQGAS